MKILSLLIFILLEGTRKVISRNVIYVQPEARCRDNEDNTCLNEGTYEGSS